MDLSHLGTHATTFWGSGPSWNMTFRLYYAVPAVVQDSEGLAMFSDVALINKTYQNISISNTTLSIKGSEWNPSQYIIMINMFDSWNTYYDLIVNQTIGLSNFTQADVNNGLIAFRLKSPMPSSTITNVQTVHFNVITPLGVQSGPFGFDIVYISRGNTTTLRYTPSATQQGKTLYQSITSNITILVVIPSLIGIAMLIGLRLSHRHWKKWAKGRGILKEEDTAALMSPSSPSSSSPNPSTP